MESTIYRFIYRFSWRQQLAVLALTAAAFPFLYFSYDVPKTIINTLRLKDFSATYFGFDLGQMSYLMLLCGIFLVLVFVNGGFKYAINVAKGRLGERMLRRLRYELYSRVLRFPLPAFKRVGQGEVISMVNAEVEPLGGFVGDAMALPAFQGGTLLTILVFMLIQEPILGLAAIALYPLQGYVIPKLQRRVNRLNRKRREDVRRVADQIGEAMAGVIDIRAHDTTNYKRSEFGDLLGRVYDTRYEIYRWKFFIKFLNNFINMVTPFFFYSIGGYLVLKGDLSLGSLVGVLAAYKDMAAPWKELLTYYEQMNEAHQRYDDVVKKFTPDGMLDEALQLVEPEEVKPFDPAGVLALANVAFAEDEISKPLENVSFTVPLNERLAIVGPAGSGKEELGLVLARLLSPTAGRVTISGQDLGLLPEAVIGRRTAYVGQPAAIFTGTVRDNLLFGLRHRPVHAAAYADTATAARRQAELAESARAGNSVDDIQADWIDYRAIGVEGPEYLTERLIDVLRAVDLDREIYEIGLRGTIDPKSRPDLADAVLRARAALRDRLQEPATAALVEPFDMARYNRNATVAENLLFGTPVGPTFDMERLAANPYVLAILDKVGLTRDLLLAGYEVAALMGELFSGVDPGNDLFEQYSFIHADDLAEFQSIVTRFNRANIETAGAVERERLLSLPFKLILARHRLGVIDAALEARLLEARAVFALELPDEAQAAVEFFDVGRYNAATSVLDNILFGKVAYGQAQGTAKVGLLIGEVVDAVGIHHNLLERGLEFEVGNAGARLSAAQRQKLAIARCLLKRPDILVMNMPTALLEHQARTQIVESVLREAAGRGLVWILERPSLAEHFDRVVVLKAGKVVEQGTFGELNRPGSSFQELVNAA